MKNKKVRDPRACMTRPIGSLRRNLWRMGNWEFTRQNLENFAELIKYMVYKIMQQIINRAIANKDRMKILRSARPKVFSLRKA